MKHLLFAALFTLAACAGSSDNVTTFYKAEAGYTALLQAAAQYVALPRCGDAAPKLCSKQEAVNQIRPAANAADATIQAAEDTIRAHPEVDSSFAIAAAQNAAQALSAVLTQYGIGGH